MWPSFLYRSVRRVLEALREHRMDAVAEDAEILALGHQLAVLRWQVVFTLHPVRPGARSHPHGFRAKSSVVIVPHHAEDDPIDRAT